MDEIKEEVKEEIKEEVKKEEVVDPAKYQAALNASTKLENLLKANDVEDVDDLVALLESGKKVHGKAVDLDKLDEIIKKATTLDQYEKYWEDERKKGETLEQRLARLEKENKALHSKTETEEKAKREGEESRKSIDFYENEIKTSIGAVEGLSDPEKAFLSWSLGVGNECNDISITDKKQIKKVVNSGMKKYTELVKQMKDEGVKEYLAGKREIPKVPSGGGDSPATPAPQLPKGLRGLRSAFKEMVTPKGG
jgi:hypothetical protein